VDEIGGVISCDWGFFSRLWPVLDLCGLWEKAERGKREEKQRHRRAVAKARASLLGNSERRFPQKRSIPS
jgi:hypothetical protein